MTVGIVICTRLESRRVYQKAIKPIAGKPAICHLVEALLHTNLPIVIAPPIGDESTFAEVLQQYIKENKGRIFFHSGHADCPLRRMHSAAEEYSFDHVIRVTHDKIFLSAKEINDALQAYFVDKSDYAFSRDLPAGAGFEIIRFSKLAEAVRKNPPPTEHISYAIKALSPKTTIFRPCFYHMSSYPLRFLLDYESDFDFMNALFSLAQKKSLTLREAIDFVSTNKYLMRINQQPEVTLYTCAYNEEAYINRCIESVMNQRGIDFEYIIIDDASTDHTLKRLVYARTSNNVRIHRNDHNMGLASSSNKALSLARGNFIMRIDADDVLIFPDAVKRLVDHAKQHYADLTYPAFIDERTGKISQGKEAHHAGGALFSKNAVNYVRFTDKLRGYDSIDFFLRAQEELSVSYYEKPTFFYTARPNSLSSSKDPGRTQIKERLRLGLRGKALVCD